MRLGVIGERAADPAAGHAALGGDGERKALVAIGGKRQFAGERIGMFKQFQATFVNAAPLFGQGRDRAAAAGEELGAQLAFERLDVIADGGVGNAQPFGGRHEAAGIDHGDEDFQTAEGGGKHAAGPDFGWDDAIYHPTSWLTI